MSSMMRLLYTIGVCYIAVCIYATYMNRTVTNVQPITSLEHHKDVSLPPSSGLDWFNKIHPYCNSVEVESRVIQEPPPSTKEGSAYAAACYALAGKIDRARLFVQSLPETDREFAANIVFEIAHPVADSGDDKSAAPLMELILEFMPDNSMALYHAGMAEFSLREDDKARVHLKRFLDIYQNDDGWRRNAADTYERIN